MAEKNFKPKSSIDLDGSTSGTVTIAAPAAAGTTTITLPATTGTVITTGDTATVTNTAGDGLNSGETIAVWLENKSPNKVTITKVQLAGTEYSYGGGGITPLTALTAGDFYGVDTLPVTPGPVTASSDDTALELEAGESVSMLLTLADNIPDGRDTQLKLTTGNGAVLVGTIVAGQQEG